MMHAWDEARKQNVATPIVTNRMEGTSVEYVLGLDLGDKFDNVTNLSKAL